MKKSYLYSLAALLIAIALISTSLWLSSSEELDMELVYSSEADYVRFHDAESGKPLFVAGKPYPRNSPILSKERIVFGDEVIAEKNGTFRPAKIIQGEPVYRHELFILPENQDNKSISPLFENALYRGKEKLNTDGRIGTFEMIDGKIAYKVQNKTGAYIVHGENRSEIYDRIPFLSRRDSKPIFTAVENGERFVVHGGKRFDSYDESYLSSVANQSKAFLVVEQNRTYVEHKGELWGGYEYIWYFKVLEGKVVVMGEEKTTSNHILSINGEVIENSSFIHEIKEVNGEPGYISSQVGTDQLIIGGEIVAESDNINTYSFSSEGIAYVKGRRGSYRGQKVVFGNQEYREFPEIKDLTMFGGKPLYTTASTVWEEDENMSLMHGSKKVMEGKDNIEIHEMGDSVFLDVEDGNQTYVYRLKIREL